MTPFTIKEQRSYLNLLFSVTTDPLLFKHPGDSEETVRAVLPNASKNMVIFTKRNVCSKEYITCLLHHNFL